MQMGGQDTDIQTEGKTQHTQCFFTVQNSSVIQKLILQAYTSVQSVYSLYEVVVLPKWKYSIQARQYGPELFVFL